MLASAIRIVAEQGLEGLTLQGLADALDYSVGALYRYFPSKERLLAELQRNVIRVLDRKTQALWQSCDERLAASAETAPAAAVLAPLVATAALYERVARLAPEPFGLLSRSLSDPGRLIDDEEAGRVFAAARPIFAGLAERFEAARRTGALGPGDPMRRALCFWAALQGVVQLRKLSRLDPELLDTSRLLHTLCDGLLCGWGAARESFEEAADWVERSGVAALPIEVDDFANEGELESELAGQD